MSHTHRRQQNLINVCVLTGPPADHSRIPLLLGPPDSLRHNNIAVRPIHHPTIASEYPSEKESHTSLRKSKARND